MTTWFDGVGGTMLMVTIIKIKTLPTVLKEMTTVAILITMIQ